MNKNVMPVAMDELEKVAGGQEPLIKEQTVVWYDGNGNKYSSTIKTKEVKMPDIIAQKVTYTDGNGKQYTIEK